MHTHTLFITNGPIMLNIFWKNHFFTNYTGHESKLILVPRDRLFHRGNPSQRILATRPPLIVLPNRWRSLIGALWPYKALKAVMDKTIQL